MYLEHFGLTDTPFRITPHTDYFFPGGNRRITLDALIDTVTVGEGIVKVIGEVGSGKTLLCRLLQERLPASVVTIYIANPSLAREDILFALADELGVEYPERERVGGVLRALQERLTALYAEGKRVAVLLDEANAMPRETLEELRLLSNLEVDGHKLLQLVLFGQPELNETLARPDMRSLRERIAHNFSLDPLARDEVAQYLDFRLHVAGYRGPEVFLPPAVEMIGAASCGLARRINLLADKSLLIARTTGKHHVGAREVRAAICETEFMQYRRKAGRGPLWIGVGMVALLAVMIVWRQLTLPSAEPPSAMPTTEPPVTASSPAQHTAPAAPPPVTSPTAIPAASSSPELEAMLARSLPWIKTVQKDRWFIQLLTVPGDQPDVVEAYLTEARKEGVEMSLLRAYQSNLSGKNRYGILYGDYASRQDAQAAIKTLPPALKSKNVYIRQAARLK